ncbi:MULTISPECIES: Bug family tripartite tricarboxylate transporter substrate binding protein [unclassified Roseateles]|uniref:Bug family tripartite tricarboxylate transporter substrate binding protein n=1 Tax=unclassified Roseateles TaxID=2626991 RepID=UPI000701B069|nr:MULTISPECIES: Bug family tripartite tricarboxylate transporter substrate binding protein [unclassified Roseateles]KQW43675.1 Twin-arginine translocation pathway signal [Pelomonas sp. Root405]KRA71413.1 Twin-arginine translocation pathway signal [Pelomonas sp. Root662]
MLQRRSALAAMAALPFATQAQDAKPIKLLVGFPAGGGTDAIARLLGEALQASLGTTVLVENKPGAGGQIAAQALKAAAPDGTTFFVSHDHTISILPLVLKSPGFDPARDFVPVAGFATFANALALSGGTPAASLPEYLAWVKKQGGQGSVGIPAPASVPEFLVKLLGEKNGLNLLGVPYRGSAPMVADMLGNQISAGVGSVPDLIANHQQKKLRIVAVMGQQRQGMLPDVPTFAELGIAGFEDLPYYGLFAPAGTPPAVIERISNALTGVVNQPVVKARLTELGLSVGMMSSAQLATRERAYAAAWARIIRSGGFQPQ